jgi:CRP/FNR family cyclic AMP-dependent transcriptional regulator
MTASLINFPIQESGMDEALNALIKMQFFSEFSEEELRALFDHGEIISVKGGTALFEEGDDRDIIYLLINGEIEVSKKDPNGKVQLLSTLGKGAVIGDMSWALQKKRGATIRAKRDAQLLQLDGAKLRKAVLAGGLGATRFAYTLLKIQAQRLDRMNQELLKILGGKKAGEMDHLRDNVLKGWSF